MAALVSILALYALGMCFAFLGSISVKLMPKLGINEGKFGTLISVYMFTSMVASLIIGVLLDSIGYKPIAIVGFILTAIVIFLFAYGKSYGMAIVAALLFGFGAMALNTAGNTLAPVVLFGGENPAAAQNLGNVFFGLGLFLTPLIVSSLFQKTTFEKAVSVLALIALVPVIFAIIAVYPASQAGFELANAVSLLSKGAVIVAAIALFFYIGLEMTFNNWLPTYGKAVIKDAGAESDPDKVDASASRLLMYFGFFMMIGRLITSFIPAITANGDWALAIAALISGFIILGMTLTKSVSQSRVLASLAGLFFGPIFPTTVGVTFAKFSPEIYGSIFGIIFAVGLLGAVVLPKAVGNIAAGSSIQKSLRLLLPVCALLIIFAILL